MGNHPRITNHAALFFKGKNIKKRVFVVAELKSFRPVQTLQGYGIQGRGTVMGRHGRRGRMLLVDSHDRWGGSLQGPLGNTQPVTAELPRKEAAF